MNYVAWACLGLVAGVLAKWLMPGPDSGGLIKTILLGVAGAMLGGYVGVLLGWGTVDGFNVQSLALAIGGSMVILFVSRLLTGRT
jgi:uncharacterized membrane protein YeaQ/YmgE (transglycosylase-associated protein family)